MFRILEAKFYDIYMTVTWQICTVSKARQVYRRSKRAGELADGGMGGKGVEWVVSHKTMVFKYLYTIYKIHIQRKGFRRKIYLGANNECLQTAEIFFFVFILPVFIFWNFCNERAPFIINTFFLVERYTKTVQTEF